MKLTIDIPEKDYKFIRDTYKQTGLSFIPPAIKCECTEAVYNGTPCEERKTGKWITERIGVRSYATKCSACGNILHRGHNFDNAQQYTEYVNGAGSYDKFCHECGAKMEVDV